MNILERFFGARHPQRSAKVVNLVTPGRCPVCGADRQRIGVASEAGEVENQNSARPAAGAILSCEKCGSRWTAPATAAHWQPRIRMTVFRREPPRPGSDEPEEICEILSDGVDGLLKVKAVEEKDDLGRVFGVSHFRFTAGGQLDDGTCYDAGRVFGAWEEANLRHIALYDLLFKPYYVGRLVCDGTEDATIRERAAEVRAVEAALAQGKQDPRIPPAAN